MRSRRSRRTRRCVLKLEDIHWSDASTLDWLAHVARRPEPARLMVLATFRPADAAATTARARRHGHRNWRCTGWCREIALDPLGLQAIETYLKARLGATRRGAVARDRAAAAGADRRQSAVHDRHRQPVGAAGLPSARLARSCRSRMTCDASSTGRSTSLTRATADLLTRGERDPPRIRDRRRRRRAGRGRRGGRSGMRTAGAAGRVHRQVRLRFDHLAGRHARRALFLPARSLPRTLVRSAAGDAPRAQPCARRPPARSRLGRPAGAIASELAEHFERGNELARAIPHHQRAAAKALRRSANQEAIGHLRRALDAIGNIADEAERTRVEVELRVALGAAYMAMRGFGAPEVLEAYSRAEALCERLGERVDIFPAIWGQWMFRTGRSEIDAPGGFAGGCWPWPRNSTMQG